MHEERDRPEHPANRREGEEEPASRVNTLHPRLSQLSHPYRVPAAQSSREAFVGCAGRRRSGAYGGGDGGGGGGAPLRAAARGRRAVRGTASRAGARAHARRCAARKRAAAAACSRLRSARAFRRRWAWAAAPRGFRGAMDGWWRSRGVRLHGLGELGGGQQRRASASMAIGGIRDERGARRRGRCSDRSCRVYRPRTVKRQADRNGFVSTPPRRLGAGRRRGTARIKGRSSPVSPKTARSRPRSPRRSPAPRRPRGPAGRDCPAPGPRPRRRPGRGRGGAVALAPQPRGALDLLRLEIGAHAQDRRRARSRPRGSG
jgi:hypothetical protein